MESQNAVRIFDVHILLNIFVSLVFKGKGALLKEVCSLCCHELLLLSLTYFFTSYTLPGSLGDRQHDRVLAEGVRSTLDLAGSGMFRE